MAVGPVTRETVLIEGNRHDIGLVARPLSSGFVAVDLGMGADPEVFTDEVVESEMRRLGCRQRPNGTWQLSWRFRKEYLRDAEASAGKPVFDQEWMDRQAASLRDPLYRMDVDVTIAELTWQQALADPPEGVRVVRDQGEVVRRLPDQSIGLGAAFWRLHPLERRREAWRWLVPRTRGRVAVWVPPWQQPAYLPSTIEAVTRCFAGGSDVGEGVAASDSTVVVLAADTKEQAAEFASNTIRPADLGRIACAIGGYFNTALMCPVRKMHGLTVIRTMSDECAYPAIWHDRIADRVAQVPTDRLGWRGGEVTSPLLFGGWIDAMQYSRVILHSSTLWRQMIQYIYDVGGRITHQALADQPVEVRERHGDLVVGAALAYRAALDMPRWLRARKRDVAPYGSLAWRDDVYERQQLQRKGEQW